MHPISRHRADCTRRRWSPSEVALKMIGRQGCIPMNRIVSGQQSDEHRPERQKPNLSMIVLNKLQVKNTEGNIRIFGSN